MIDKSVHICDCSALKDMKSQLNQIQLQVNQMLNLLQGHIGNAPKRHNSSGPILLEDIIEDPCQTLSQLEQLEKDLNDGNCNKSELVCFCSSF